MPSKLVRGIHCLLECHCAEGHFPVTLNPSDQSVSPHLATSPQKGVLNARGIDSWCLLDFNFLIKQQT